jgi:lipid-A-disaccharide synthase
MLAKLLGVPAWTYATRPDGRCRFDRILVPDPQSAERFLSRGVEPGRVSIVGQLAVDFARPTSAQAGISAPATVAFLPGSREAHARFLVPYYASVANEIHVQQAEAQFLLLWSAFVPRTLVHSLFGSIGWSISAQGRWLQARSPGGVTMTVVPGGVDSLPEVDIAVTLPGTNTLELAARGVPFIVIAPGQRPDLVPLGGPVGLLAPTSWLGATLRKFALRRLGRLPFFAAPNIIADTLIVPELRGVNGCGRVDPPTVASRVMALLNAPEERRVMSRQLREVAGPPGAGDRVTELVLGWFQSCVSAS